MNKKFNSLLSLLAILTVMFLVGCSAGNSGLPSVTPVEETYEFTEKNQVYTRPAMTIEERRLDSLTLTLDDGFYFCVTTDTEKATEFINTQRTLLQFLNDSGVETGKLRYYAVDYDDSFSDSENGKAYIALSHAKSYRQVLVTLQTLWGDYTDYGYIYHVANAIAAHLDWQTEAIEPVEQSVLDTFFAKNPDALNLLYPCFTTTYADEETVRNCHALSAQLFEKIDLSKALAKPIEEQVNDFRALVDSYAQERSITFDRQKNGYAYYGEYLPLKILTTYAAHIVDRGYEDSLSPAYEAIGDYSFVYFSDYRSIFEIADLMDKEITSTVEQFNLEDKAGVVIFKWLSEDSLIKRSGKAVNNFYNFTAQEVYLTTIDAYLHEYAHHLEHLINPNLGTCWQEQAFCEIVRSHAQHGQYQIETAFTLEEDFAELFYNCTGHNYQTGLDDYWEAYDIMCFITGEWDLDYLYGKNGINSFLHYLLDLYGEENTYQLLLFPETMEAVTGKTWEEQEKDWLSYMAEKFEGVEIPDWVS